MTRLGLVATVTAVAAAFLGVQAQSPLFLVQNHTGANFLNNWDFYSGWDVNNTGAVEYQSQDAAQQLGLTFVNSAGNFVIKVDNTTDGGTNSSFLRPSVKILTSYTISSGDLVIFDAVHLPYGCSVWPAFWSQGPVWPDNGEIDIIEGVNLVTENRISLHTLDGCNHPDASVSNSIQTGPLLSTDCFNRTNFDQGCLTAVPGPSYGAPFAAAGGGVYALQWNDTGMFMWFWPRGSIPADVPTSSPNPAGWGLPTAAYPTSSCDFNTFFTPQSLILETTICGNFAGNPPVFTQTCSGTCLDLVQDPSNFDQAYFELSYMRVFSVNPPPAGSNSSSTSTSAGSGASGTETSGGQGAKASASSARGVLLRGLGLHDVVQAVLLASAALAIVYGS